MSQQAAAGTPVLGDGTAAADLPGSGAGRRWMSVWLALPVVVAFGAGGGYLAAEAWAPAARPPAVAAPSHSSHDAARAHEHGAAQSPGQHDAAGGQQSTGGHESTGHESTGHESTGHESTGHESTGHESSGGHDEPVVAGRPRTAVLTGFAAVNVALLLAAAIVRRRPRPTRRIAPTHPA